MLKLIVPLLLMGNLSQAQEALNNQQYPQAVEYFQQAIEKESSYEALYGLAKAQAFSGDYAAALNTYNTLIEAYPDNGDALLGRAQVESWLKDYSAAEKDYKRVLELNTDYTEAWQGLMRIYGWQDQEAPALALFERWQQAKPESSTPFLSRAQLYFNQRRFTLAREDLQKARALGASDDEVNPLLTRLNRLPGALPWEASLNYELQGFTAQNDPWHTVTGGVRYNFDRASLALQSITTQRFGFWDQGVIADSYFDLWSGAYGNVRAQAVFDANVLPQFDILGELYQTFADTWEVSGAYRLMSYPSNQIHFAQGSVGKYWGNWYFRVQPTLFLASTADQEAGPGGNVALWARYYYATVDDYIEVRTGLGRRIAVVGADTGGAQLQGQTNAFGLLSAQYFITPRIGITGTLNYNYDEQFADRYGGSIGSLYRF